jgi:hypothetical protein
MPATKASIPPLAKADRARGSDAGKPRRSPSKSPAEEDSARYGRTRAHIEAAGDVGLAEADA